MDHSEGQKPGRRREASAETVGSYAIVTQIASGEFTTVHLAQKHGALGFHRLAAIKRLKPAYGQPEWTQLLLDEARLSAGVHHANIVDVIDVGTDAGCYLIMEYIEGADLEVLLARAGKERHARYVVPPIVDALHGLHAVHTAVDELGESLAMVHQAPRARHILIGIDGTARITDFGQVAARGLIPSSLRPQRLRPAYLASEQVLAPERVDARTDLFIVGIALWEALTGERLFQAESPELTRRAVLEKPIPRPSEVGVKPPRCFDAICARALQRDPDLRYASALDMARDLRDTALNEALYATSGELGQWVRALAGRALIERRRAIGADAPSLEIPIEGGGSGPSPFVTQEYAPSYESPRSVSGTTPLDPAPLPPESSRVARSYAVPVAEAGRAERAPLGFPPPPAALLGIGDRIAGPGDAGGARAAAAGDPRARGGGVHGAGQWADPGATPFAETPDCEPTVRLRQEELGAVRSAVPPGFSSDQVARRPAPAGAAGPSAAPGGEFEHIPGGAFRMKFQRAEELPAGLSPAQAYARRVRASYDEASGSLRPPTGAMRPYPPSEVEEPARGWSALGIISTFLVAIILVAGFVGLRQWSGERERARPSSAAGGLEAPAARPGGVSAPAAPELAAPASAPSAASVPGAALGGMPPAGVDGAGATVAAPAPQAAAPEVAAPETAAPQTPATGAASRSAAAPQVGQAGQALSRNLPDRGSPLAVPQPPAARAPARGRGAPGDAAALGAPGSAAAAAPATRAAPRSPWSEGAARPAPVTPAPAPITNGYPRSAFTSDRTPGLPDNPYRD